MIPSRCRSAQIPCYHYILTPNSDTYPYWANKIVVTTGVWNQGLRICNTQTTHLPINIVVNTTNKMALEAAAKAEAMGWEVRIKLDQSDVIDYATVVAWAPGATQVRYITFIEGHMSTKGWRDRSKLDGLLDYHLAL